MNIKGHFETITRHKLLVMKYCFALPAEPAGKAVFHHQQPVPGDGLKMAFDVHAFRHLTVTFPSLRFRRSPLSEKSSRS